jgi:hypothetical protein
MAHRSVLLFLNKLVFFFKKKILFGSFGFALLRVASLSSGNSGVSVHAAHELVRASHWRLWCIDAVDDAGCAGGCGDVAFVVVCDVGGVDWSVCGNSLVSKT